MLKEVDIPDGTEKIGSEWFRNTAIEIVKIPASVTKIEAKAFYNCRNLRRVMFAENSKLDII